jgi:phage gp29-like protein
MLARLAEMGLPIPIDILLDSMDIPRKEEIVQRVKAQQEQQAQMQAQQGGQQKGRASPPKQQSLVGRAG